METVKLLIPGVESVVHDMTLVPHDTGFKDIPTPAILFKHRTVQSHCYICTKDKSNTSTYIMYCVTICDIMTDII